MQAQGMRRIELFMIIAGSAEPRPGSRLLTSAGYLPDPSGFMSAGINKALAYISEQPDRAVQRERTSPRSPASRQRLFAQLPPPHRHGAGRNTSTGCASISRAKC